jgi:hypothetical protein
MTRIELTNQLDGMRKLQQPNWDSYGSDPVSEEAMRTAQVFVDAVWSQFGTNADRFNLVAGPTPDGGVSLLLRGRGEMKIEVCFPPSSRDVPTYLLTRPGIVKDKGTVHNFDHFAKHVLPLVFA